MKFISVKTGYFFLILIGPSIHSAWSMEEVQEEEEMQVVEPTIEPSQVKPLTELAIQPAVENILSNKGLSIQSIHTAVSRFPMNLRIPLALDLIKDTRFPGNAVNKLRLAYHVSEDAGNQQIPQLDALFDEVIKNIDPCYFVHKPVALLLPDHQENQFTLRDERLIKAILRKPGLKLAGKYLKQPVLSIQAKANTSVNGVISPDGTKFAWGTEGNTLCVWNLQQNKPAALFRLPPEFQFDPPIAWSSDNRVIAVGAGDGSVHFWQIDAMEQPVVRLQVPGMSPYFNEWGTDPADRADVTRFEAKQPQLSAVDTQFLQGLSADTGVNLEQHDILPLFIRQPDRNLSATWYVIRRTNMPSRIHFTADDHPVYSISFSPDGNFLTTLSEQGRVRIWNVKNIHTRSEEALASITPLFEQTFEGENPPVAAVASAQGKRLAVAPVGGRVIVVDVEFGAPIAEVTTDDWDHGYRSLGSNAIALSPDGKYLAYTYAGNYYLYDIDNHKQVLEFARGHVAPTQVFSPGQSFRDDGGFVSCGIIHPLIVYGIRSRGNLKVAFAYADEEPGSLSADGNYFVSRSARGVMKFNIWHLPADYLKGNLTWQQLRDELARMCLQIVPVKNREIK